jgi:flagellar basal body P-ring formation protein FlgA
MLRIVTIAGLLLLTAPAAQADIARPSLKPSATVTAEVVHIGDLVEHAGTLADIAIFRSPDLGTTGSVPTSQVRDALRRYGLADFDADGLNEVVVTRPSRAITVKEIETRIIQSLAGQRGLGAADDLRLNLDQSLRTIHVEASATAELQVVRLAIDPYGSRFSIVLDVPGSALLRRTPLRLTGRVVETAETAVLVRSLQRGDVVRQEDFAIERRPRTEISQDSVNRPEHAIGLAMRRASRAGHLLRQADLMKPELVKRNDTVTLVYEVPGILVTIRGQATEAGAKGDTIGVLNLQSKRTVHGTVTGAGQVTVTGTVAQIGPAKTASLQSPDAPSQPE